MPRSDADKLRDEISTLLAKNLNRLREDRHLSQEDLAALTKGVVKQVDVSRIERAEVEPGSTKLWALAHALNVPIQELFAGAPRRASTESLEMFLASPLALAHDVTEEEKQQLRAIGWPLERPTMLSWFHILMAERAQSPRK